MQEVALTITGDSEYNGPTEQLSLESIPPFHVSFAFADDTQLRVDLVRRFDSDTEVLGKVTGITLGLTPSPFQVGNEFSLSAKPPDRRAYIGISALDAEGNPQSWDSDPKSGTIRIIELNSDWIGLELINVSPSFIFNHETSKEKGRPTINGTIRLIRTDR